MKNSFRVFLFLIGLFGSSLCSAQEGELKVEDSAEVFLEEYSDDFQENFFEALKQKGIENYDKAIPLLLKCKKQNSNNSVIDHELAKSYVLDKQYILAQDYGIIAVNAEPENLWYLNTLVLILKKQGTTIDFVKKEIPFTNSKLQENLALVYYKNKNYKKALNILSGIKKTQFTEDLTVKIEDALEQIKTYRNRATQANVVKKEESPLDAYKAKISTLLAESNFSDLIQVTNNAIESFPSQPYFYYVNGLALHKNAKHKEAISALEEALDYMLDNKDLTHKIYRELANAHTALGNTSKANMYLSKIKSGL